MSIRHYQPSGRAPSAGHVVWAWAGQGRPIRPLWILDSGDTEPQEVFLLVLGDRSTSRLAVMKLACVRSHFHITQPDKPGG